MLLGLSLLLNFTACNLPSGSDSDSSSIQTLAIESTEVDEGVAEEVSDLSFCVNEIILYKNGDETDIAVRKSDIGLIELGAGDEVKEWGSVELLPDVSFDTITIKIAANAELCGVDYSVSLNGEEVESDLELKFDLEVDEEGNLIELDLTTAIEDLLEAIKSGAFEDEWVKDYFDGGSRRCKARRHHRDHHPPREDEREGGFEGENSEEY